METATLKALKESIAKWEKNAEADQDKIVLGVTGCPLCSLFWRSAENESCIGCPVFSSDKHFRCGNTPFDEADDAFSNWHDEGTDEWRDAFRAAAQAEVDFLKSLLPVEA